MAQRKPKSSRKTASAGPRARAATPRPSRKPARAPKKTSRTPTVAAKARKPAAGAAAAKARKPVGRVARPAPSTRSGPARRAAANGRPARKPTPAKKAASRATAPAAARRRPAGSDRVSPTAPRARTASPRPTLPVIDLEPDENDVAHEAGPSSSLDLSRGKVPRRRQATPDEEPTHPGAVADPHLVAGDVDADWASAYSVGDEAPGGDNPTPDQDVVELIGRSLGIEYEDDEELEGGEEIVARDRHRWELDPASSEDWKDRKK